MKKTFTTFLAIATIVALAVPAGADKPPGKGKPGVHVLVTAAPGWAVHAAEDVIAYTVEVVNRGSIALSEVSVTGGFQHIEVPMELTFEGGDVDSNDALDPGETWHYTGWYTVAAVDLSLAAISSIIQVRDGSESPVASVSIYMTMLCYNNVMI